MATQWPLSKWATHICELDVSLYFSLIISFLFPLLCFCLCNSDFSGFRFQRLALQFSYFSFYFIPSHFCFILLSGRFPELYIATLWLNFLLAAVFILFTVLLCSLKILFMACCSYSVGAITSLTPKAITSFSGCVIHILHYLFSCNSFFCPAFSLWFLTIPFTCLMTLCCSFTFE